MKFSKRFDTIEPYLFVGISKTIAEKKKQGIDVISFGIGDPDIPTPKNLYWILCLNIQIIQQIIDTLNRKVCLFIEKQSQNI